jgi:hypothetical protein
MLRLLPILAVDRTDSELLKLHVSRTETEDAIVTVPNTEKPLPQRATARTDNDDPIAPKSNVLNCKPTLAKARMLTELASLKQSTTDSSLVHRECPFIESPDPNLATALVLKLDPIDPNLRTETSPPIRVVCRTEKLDPMVVLPRIET